MDKSSVKSSTTKPQNSVEQEGKKKYNESSANELAVASQLPTVSEGAGPRNTCHVTSRGPPESQRRREGRRGPLSYCRAMEEHGNSAKAVCAGCNLILIICYLAQKKKGTNCNLDNI